MNNQRVELKDKTKEFLSENGNLTRVVGEVKDYVRNKFKAVYGEERWAQFAAFDDEPHNEEMKKWTIEYCKKNALDFVTLVRMIRKHVPCFNYDGNDDCSVFCLETHQGKIYCPRDQS